MVVRQLDSGGETRTDEGRHACLKTPGMMTSELVDDDAPRNDATAGKIERRLVMVVTVQVQLETARRVKSLARSWRSDAQNCSRLTPRHPAADAPNLKSSRPLELLASREPLSVNL